MAQRQQRVPAPRRRRLAKTGTGKPLAGTRALVPVDLAETVPLLDDAASDVGQAVSGLDHQGQFAGTGNGRQRSSRAFGAWRGWRRKPESLSRLTHSAMRSPKTPAQIVRSDRGVLDDVVQIANDLGVAAIGRQQFDDRFEMAGVGAVSLIHLVFACAVTRSRALHRAWRSRCRVVADRTGRRLARCRRCGSNGCFTGSDGKLH